jgi:PTH2 family peptidyl-tRNA hydrolase
MSEMKQVIVIRSDLNMRKGKMVAQGAHASMAAVISNGQLSTDERVQQWLDGSFVKVVVSVDSEKQLFEVYDNAQNAGVLRSIIQDEGRTEFNGVPTYTAVAIGPGDPEEINKITGHLKLL